MEKDKILLVEDDRAYARLASLILEKSGFEVTVAHSARQAVERLKSQYFPIIVSDLYLGEETSLSLLQYTKNLPKPSFIIFITGQSSMDTTVRAIHGGAFAYLSKPSDLSGLENDLISIIRQALEQIRFLEKPSEMVRTRDLGQLSNRTLIGKAPAIVAVFRQIAKASLSKGNVIILGESGTGKELVAHAIHENSPWANQPFVTVNCSSLSETLLESELFGHVKGSFTGAISNKRGLFEEAHGGTLFLDEIGDISPTLQVKLLRAIQEGEIRPVGANENQKVNVRIVAATHKDLKSLVQQSLFREDLYYRLKVFLIHVPPLRERLEDLPDLIENLVLRINQKNSQSISAVSEEALRLLAQYSWPGNIRELENAIERAAALSTTGVLFPEDFGEEIALSSLAPNSLRSPGPEDLVSLEKLEHDHILKVLHKVNFNKTKTAEILGIDRGTLYRKADRYHIPLDLLAKEERVS